MLRSPHDANKWAGGLLVRPGPRRYRSRSFDNYDDGREIAVIAREDYAIAKCVALHEIGIANDDLRLVVVHDRPTNEDHVVAAVRYDNHWQIFDNRTLDIRQDVDNAEFNPLFVIDGEGVKHMTTVESELQGPEVNAIPAAVDPQFQSGWQSTPLLL